MSSAWIIRASVLCLVGLGCGSCSEQYLARRDTMSPGSGDSINANSATQVINPWPASANRVDMPTDGTLVQHAMENYRNPTAGAAQAPPAAAATPTVK